jgi:hypothetical protein
VVLDLRVSERSTLEELCLVYEGVGGAGTEGVVGAGTEEGAKAAATGVWISARGLVISLPRRGAAPVAASA